MDGKGSSLLRINEFQSILRSCKRSPKIPKPTNCIQLAEMGKTPLDGMRQGEFVCIITKWKYAGSTRPS